MLSNELYGLVLNGRSAFAKRREFFESQAHFTVASRRRKQFRHDSADGMGQAGDQR
jgi:hypothetical protein